jgi:Fic family protein
MAYEPTYTITQAILTNIGAIEGSREVILHAALVPAWEAQFRKDALQRTVHHGTHLEGNELSKEQADRLVAVEATVPETAAEQAGIVARDRDIQEVINYRKVMGWIDKLGIDGSEKISLGTDLLKQAHRLTTERILPETEQGEYRKVQVVIKNSKTGEITYRPPLHMEIPYQVEELFGWLNSKEGKTHHPILRAGITHYELVRIHPFTDGNGRAARSLALLLLYLEGYDVKRFFSLEEYYDENPVEYYQALQTVSNNEALDLSLWLEYFTKGLAIELDRIKQQVLKLSKDVQLKTRVGHQVALSERQISILESMQKNAGRMASSELENLLPLISVDTILRDLKDLTNKGLIKKKGQTKGAYYLLVE